MIQIASRNEDEQDFFGTDSFDINDNLDNFDGGVDDSSDDNSNFDSDGFGEFGGTDSSSDQSDGTDKRKLLKTIFIPCIIGVIVIVAILIIVPTVLKGRNSKTENSDTPKTSASQNQNEGQDNQNQDQDNVTKVNPNANLTEWISFSQSDVSFNDERISSTFTVLGIKHFVKVASSTNEIQVKSVITGNLSGFTGTYDIEIPYSKGSLLSIGNSFSVEVQIGEYNGNKVVGEIKY